MAKTVQQAGVLPWRAGLIALITSRRRSRWVIPKGNIKPGQTDRAAAKIEAWEEAGLSGTLAPQALGTFSYVKLNRFHLVTVYLLFVEFESEIWPEYQQRQRAWFSIEQALAVIDEPELCSLIGLIAPKLMTV